MPELHRESKAILAGFLRLSQSTKEKRMEVPFSSKVCTQEAPSSVSSVAETNQTNKPTNKEVRSTSVSLSGLERGCVGGERPLLGRAMSSSVTRWEFS